MNPIKTFAFIILASGSFGSASAQISWDGGGSDNIWSTAANWSDDSIPTAGNDYVVDAATVQAPTRAPRPSMATT